MQELDRIDQFVTMRGDIVTNIMLGRSRLPKAKDETGNIENFYKYKRENGWRISLLTNISAISFLYFLSMPLSHLLSPLEQH